jgi:3-methylcrotonyl-CoA carboxylase alpha subunit
MTGREIHWKSGDHEIPVRIDETGDHGTARIGDQIFTFVLQDRDSTGGWLDVGGKNRRFYVYRNRDEVTVWIEGHTYRLTKIQKGQVPDQAAATGSGEVRALMPGKILRIDVAPGDEVVDRQTVVTMESMKMETALAAPRSGRVTAVNCQVGQTVDMGELLVIIE